MKRADKTLLDALVNGLPRPRQARSFKTQEGFIDAGWAIVREQPWETISVTDVAQRANRSVGAFYQRFGSKEDFLSVLLHRWLERGYSSTLIDRDWEDPAALVDTYLTDSFTRIRENRFLWRAALQRAVDDPESWEPFRQMGTWRRERLADRLGELRGKPFTPAEKQQLALGLQVFNSVINNALLNNPGPLKLEDPYFLPVMLKVFRMVTQLEAVG
jgi:AcrR family transcriptional regulator